MLLTVLVLASLLGLSYLLVSLPWLWRPPPVPMQVNVGNDAVLFVSDLHLDNPESISRSLLSLVEETKPATLVVVGDLLHAPQDVGSDRQLLDFVMAVLERLDRMADLKGLLVTMSENHDPPLTKGELTFECRGTRVMLTHDPIMIEAYGVRVLAVHGDYFCSDGAITAGVELLLSALGVRGATERFLRWKIGMDNQNWVVMGHTHLPMIDQGRRIANCGSFHGHPMRGASSTAVLLRDGRLRMLGKSNC